MVTISSLQLNAWLVTLLWPAARVLALIATCPLFGHRSVPVRVKLGLGLLLSLAISPTVPVAIPALSLPGFLILAQQLLIGSAMGLAMRLVFAAVEMAGEVCGLTMGLSFASQFDPLGEHQSTVISQLFGWLALLVFVSSNLHLATLAALADSFQQLPVTATPMGTGGFRQFVLSGGRLFASALHIAMPVVAALLVTNLALGILTRAAPQLNLFSIGMPVTLAVGFLTLMVTLPYIAQPIVHALTAALTALSPH